MTEDSQQPKQQIIHNGDVKSQSTKFTHFGFENIEEEEKKRKGRFFIFLINVLFETLPNIGVLKIKMAEKLAPYPILFFIYLITGEGCPSAQVLVFKGPSHKIKL